MTPILQKNINFNPSVPAKSARWFWFEMFLLLAVCGLFYWFVVLPKRSALADKQSQLTQLQDQQKQMETSLATFKNLVKDLDSHSKEVSDLDYALPLDGRVTELQILLESMAKTVGVTIGDISVNPQNDEIWAGNTALLADPYSAQRSLKKLSGTVYVLGSFDQLEAFLQKLETSARIIDVSSLNIDSGPAGSLGLRLTVSAYYLAP